MAAEPPWRGVWEAEPTMANRLIPTPDYTYPELNMPNHTGIRVPPLYPPPISSIYGKGVESRKKKAGEGRNEGDGRGEGYGGGAGSCDAETKEGGGRCGDGMCTGRRANGGGGGSCDT